MLFSVIGLAVDVVGAVVLTLVLLEGKDPRRWGEINHAPRSDRRSGWHAIGHTDPGVAIALLRLLLAGAAFVRRALPGVGGGSCGRCLA